MGACCLPRERERGGTKKKKRKEKNIKLTALFRTSHPEWTPAIGRRTENLVRAEKEQKKKLGKGPRKQLGNNSVTTR